MPTFGERLRELRDRAGLTQEQLADAAGLPVGSVRNYEQGHREPLWHVVFKLAEAMRVDVNAFADAVGQQEPAGPTPGPGRPRKQAAASAGPKKIRGRKKKGED